MKKIFLLISLIAVSVLPGISSRLTAEEALARFNRNDRQRVPGKLSQGSPRLKATIGGLYIYQNDSKGFIILPDDDAAPALLGYSDSSDFDLENNPSLKYWLDFYNSELDYLHSSKAESKSTPDKIENARRNADEALISPMLKTEWNQEAPYNLMCPKVDGRGTVTGCVATAMSQAMKFYNYPEHGKGKHSYFWRPGEEELTFDYENTPFQWDLMDNRYDSKSSEESKKAVAELMLACGVSVDMHYDVGESGAATIEMGNAFINIFDYSPSLWMANRVYYGYDEWEDMIYSNLAQGMPVLYSGAGTAGGHQFVCDGYGGNGFFHFNWGWGGMSNGYFLLTALNPADLGVGGGAGGFNTSQVATLGFRPPREGDAPVYVVYNTRDFSTDVKTIKAEEDFRCEGSFFNFSLWTLPDNSHLGMKFSTPDGDVVKYVDGPGMGGYRTYDGRGNDQIKFPSLGDGTYIITPAFNVEGNWSDVNMPVGYSSSVTVTITDGVGIVKNDNGAVISISDIATPPTIYRNQEFPMPFSVKNETQIEYYGTVTPVLRDSEGNTVAKSKFRPLDILPGETVTISDYVGDFSVVKDGVFSAGDYTLLFIDETGKAVSSEQTVTVAILTEKTKIKVTDFKLKEDKRVTDPSAVHFTFTLTCETGVFYGTPSIIFFPGDGGDELERENGEPIYLESGESKDIEIVANLERLKNGHYMALVYNGNEDLSRPIPFTIDREDGIQTIRENEENSFKIYDLNGIEHRKPLKNGIYIINGKKIMVN